MPLTTRQRLAGTSNADSISNLVLPEVPFTPMPPKLSQSALERWNQKNHEALKRWREQVNAKLTGVQST